MRKQFLYTRLVVLSYLLRAFSLFTHARAIFIPARKQIRHNDRSSRSKHVQTNVYVISTIIKKIYPRKKHDRRPFNRSKMKPSMAALRNLESLLRHVATLDHHRIDPSLLAPLSLFLFLRLCPTNASTIHYSRWTASKQRYIAIYCTAPPSNQECNVPMKKCSVQFTATRMHRPRFLHKEDADDKYLLSLNKFSNQRFIYFFFFP